MKFYATIILFFVLLTHSVVHAQKASDGWFLGDNICADNLEIRGAWGGDTSKKVTLQDTATVKPKPKPKHDPRIATRRSLIFPGLGQIYNREYWKLPIVYGALSIPTITFFYNNTWYKRTKFAYEAKFAFAEKYGSTPPANADSSDIKKIDSRLINLSTGSLQSYRNIFRRDRDYSVLWFLVVWGLNVADATVFAHLKEFDVSENLSMKVKPTINPLTRNNEMKLVFHFKKPEKKLVDVR